MSCECWHIRWKQAGKPERPHDPRQALSSAHRPLREAAARRLAAESAGRDFLRQQLGSADVRVRAASLTALIDAGDRQVDLNAVADKDPQVPIRAMALCDLPPPDKPMSAADVMDTPSVQLIDCREGLDVERFAKFIGSL